MIQQSHFWVFIQNLKEELKWSEVKFSQSRLTLCDPIEFMEFSRPEYWSR